MSPVGGEQKDMLHHSKHQATDDSWCVCRMQRDVQVQVEGLFEYTCFDATRSDAELQVHEVNSFCDWRELPFKFSEAIHGSLEIKEVFAIGVWIWMMSPDT